MKEETNPFFSPRSFFFCHLLEFSEPTRVKVREVRTGQAYRRALICLLLYQNILELCGYHRCLKLTFFPSCAAYVQSAKGMILQLQNSCQRHCFPSATRSLPRSPESTPQLCCWDILALAENFLGQDPFSNNTRLIFIFWDTYTVDLLKEGSSTTS